MELKDVIKELSEIDAPSGFEDAAAKRVSELLKPYVDEVRIDNMGNVLGFKGCGKKGAKRLLIEAHIDEVGFIVTGIDEGFLKLSEIGGPDIRTLPSAQLKILTEPPIFGVVACMPVHTIGNEEMNKAAKLKDLYADVGMSGECAAEKIPLGTPAVFHSVFKELGEGQVCGKALDDRAGMAVILRSLSLLENEELDVDLIIMGSVQEEIGLRGAVAGTFGACPDYALSIDVTYAKTHDYKKDDAMDSGGGPAIGVGPNMTRALSDRLIALAKEKEIRYQLEIMGGDTGTNAWVIQTSREGVATALVSLPLKYMHTQNETLRLSDAEALSRLVAAFVISLKGGEL